MLFWVAIAVVLAATLTPSRMMPSVIFQYSDKVQHALAFGGLAVLGLVGYTSHWRRVLIGLFVLGGAIEVAQALTGWRDGEWADWLADGIGIALALGLLWLARRIRAAASA